MWENEAEFFHYVRKRFALELQANRGGNEFDVLGFYLEDGLTLPLDAVGHHPPLMLLGKGTGIGKYFWSRWFGQEAPRPRYPLTNWWRSVVQFVQDMRGRTWTEMTFALMELPVRQQKSMQWAFDRAVRVARQRQRVFFSHHGELVHHPPIEESMIISIVYRGLTPDQAEERTRKLVQQEQARRNGTYIVAVIHDVDDDRAPFSAMGAW